MFHGLLRKKKALATILGKTMKCIKLDMKKTEDTEEGLEK